MPRGDVESAVRWSGGRSHGAGGVEVLGLSPHVGERLGLVYGARNGLVLVVQVLCLWEKEDDKKNNGRELGAHSGTERRGGGSTIGHIFAVNE